MRTLTEWLVVPLFVLPLVAAGALFVWARDAHRRDLQPFAGDGARTAQAWLTGPAGLAAELPFDARLRDVVDRAYDDGIAVRLPGGKAGLVLEEPRLGREAWTFAAHFPDGLSPDALADPGVRLQVESGHAPVEVGGQSAEAAAFARLLDKPSLDGLRTAPLPSATKRFLVYRWIEKRPANEEARAAARLLEIVRRLERALEALPSPLGPGAWRHEDLRLLVAPGASGRMAVFAESAGTSPAPPAALVLTADGAEEDAARLVWAFPDWRSPKEDLLWTGRLDAPFAGAFAFQAKHGPKWWQAPRVRRYAGPVLALLLASLLLPLALFFTVRRRRRLDEARVRFLNELAHDLRTPLTSLRLHADFLQSGKAMPEKQERYAARIATESARLSSLLGNLLDLSRLESGRRAYEIAPVGIVDVAEGARQELRAVFPSRKDDVVLEGDAAVAAAADRSALSRAVLNLLENAAKFTAPGTPIRVRWAKEGNAVAIVVEDDGPGIAPEERGRVFERYRRGRAAQQDGIPGTGLGLALVKELVEGMGGTVSLLPDKGAAFEIRLGASDA